MSKVEKTPLLIKDSKQSFEVNSSKLNTNTMTNTNFQSKKHKYFDVKLLDKIFFFWVNKIVKVKYVGRHYFTF